MDIRNQIYDILRNHREKISQLKEEGTIPIQVAPYSEESPYSKSSFGQVLAIPKEKEAPTKGEVKEFREFLFEKIEQASSLKDSNLNPSKKYYVSKDSQVLFLDDSGLLITNEKPQVGMGSKDFTAVRVYHPSHRGNVAAIILNEDGTVKTHNCIGYETSSQNPAEDDKKLSMVLSPYVSNDVVKTIFDFMKLPSVSEAEIQKMKLDQMRQQETQREVEQIIADSKSKQTKTLSYDVTSSAGVTTVGQKEASVASFEEGSKKYLQSFGAGPCVIVSMYSNNKRGSLAHIDALTELNRSFKDMTRKLGAKLEDVQVSLHGGTDIAFISKLYTELLSQGFTKESIQTIEMNEDYGSKAVALDLETGEVANLIGNPPKIDETQMKIMSMTAMMRSPVKFVE